MAYRKPFTPEQRREAVRAYRSYRQHRASLKRDFPPLTTKQRRILKQYGEVISQMVDLLRRVDRYVDVGALNRADAWARWLATDYWRLRG